MKRTLESIHPFNFISDLSCTSDEACDHWHASEKEGVS